VLAECAVASVRALAGVVEHSFAGSEFDPVVVGTAHHGPNSIGDFFQSLYATVQVVFRAPLIGTFSSQAADHRIVHGAAEIAHGQRDRPVGG